MTNKEISKAMDSAYKKAGNNAYFGNGFKAGVELMQQKNNEMLNLLNKAKDAFSSSVFKRIGSKASVEYVFLSF